MRVTSVLHTSQCLVWRHINSCNRNHYNPLSLFRASAYRKISTIPFNTNMSDKSHLGEQGDESLKVHVHKDPKKDNLTISFQYCYGGKSKIFALSRKPSEPLMQSLERIRLNVNKVYGKLKQQVNHQVTHVSLLTNGIDIDPAAKNIDAWVEGAILRVNDKTYTVSINDPQVERIKLPDVIMKNFVLVPTISLINCSVHTSKFIWYRRISSQERTNMMEMRGVASEKFILDGRFYWYELSNEQFYRPTGEDVAHFLKVVCLPQTKEKVGLEAECVSQSPVEIGPSNCPFEARHKYTNHVIGNENEFRFMTYNILADLYADSDYSRNVLFGYCPAYALNMNYRRQLLLKEISGYNSDIICLQEVDKREYLNTFGPFFREHDNFLGVFDSKAAQVGEGLATFFRKNKFVLLDTHKTLLADLIEERKGDQPLHGETAIVKEDSIDINPSGPHPILGDLSSANAQRLLSQFDDIRQAIKSNPNASKRFLNRHTVLQTSLFKFKQQANDFIIVANTHLYFAPDADHVRLLQGSVSAKYVEFIKEFYIQMLREELGLPNPRVGVMFCGDFNSSPDCGIYGLLTSGRVGPDFKDWTSCEQEEVKDLQVETNLRFRSAYENIEYTNYTPEFHGCLDYIYYENELLICDSTIPLPDHQDVIAIGGIPSDKFPSDHLPLIANMRLK